MTETQTNTGTDFTKCIKTNSSKTGGGFSLSFLSSCPRAVTQIVFQKVGRLWCQRVLSWEKPCTAGRTTSRKTLTFSTAIYWERSSSTLILFLHCSLTKLWLFLGNMLLSEYWRLVTFHTGFQVVSYNQYCVTCCVFSTGGLWCRQQCIPYHQHNQVRKAANSFIFLRYC